MNGERYLGERKNKSPFPAGRLIRKGLFTLLNVTQSSRGDKKTPYTPFLTIFLHRLGNQRFINNFYVRQFAAHVLYLERVILLLKL